MMREENIPKPWGTAEREIVAKIRRYDENKRYLKKTDFYRDRLAETGEEIPADVLEKRLKAREEIRFVEDN